jgi:uncharacterized protein YjbI with pentapeptide repeats
MLFSFSYSAQIRLENAYLGQALLKKLTSEEWNLWRLNHPTTHPNLKNADLKKLDLSGFDLRETDFSNACLDETNLNYAILMNANCENASMRHVEMQSASAYFANFKNVDFCDSNLQRTNFSSSDMQACNFSKANLSDSIMIHTLVTKADMTQANTEGANMYGTKQ